MNRKGKELKRIARGNLEGHYLEIIQIFVLCNLLVSLIKSPFSMMTTDDIFTNQNLIYIIAVILITIASTVLTVGQYCLHLSIARTGTCKVKDFLYPIKYDSNRLIFAEIFLWLLRLIGLLPIGGAFAIIFLYENVNEYFVLLLMLIGCICFTLIELTFGLLYFVLIDNDDFTVLEAFKTTRQLIKHHLGRYLYLKISFLGMYVLTILTFGIGMLWVQPYIMQTTTLFYLDIKGEIYSNDNRI